MIDFVIVRDKDRKQIGIIDLFSSIIWQRQYYGTGQFEIYCTASKKNVELLKVGNYVTRYDDEEIGIIEKIGITWDYKNGVMITASGRFAKSILDRRLIYKFSGTQNAPTVIRGNIETAVRSLVTSHIISPTDTKRQISFIALGAVAGITKTIIDENGNSADKQTSYGYLLEFTDDLLQEYKCGARMTLDASTKNLLYSVYEGADRSTENTAGNDPVIFSQTFDNLQSSAYEYDETTLKTTALIGGSGENLDRFYAMTGTAASGLERREVFVDSSSISRTYEDSSGNKQEYTDAEYKSFLVSNGDEEIAARSVIKTFDGDIEITNSQYKYKTDFDIGDVVTVRDDNMELSMSARLATITEVQDVGGYRLAVTFES